MHALNGKTRKKFGLAYNIIVLLCLLGHDSPTNNYYASAQEAFDYPHSRAYKRYVWEEYNIGQAETLDIKFDTPTSSSALGYAAKHKTDHSFPEPAHVKLCRAFLDPPVPPQAGKARRVLIIEEDDLVCNSEANGGSSYASLIRIYASAVVAHVAHIFGRNDLFYQHGCGTRLASKYTKRKKWAEKGTIQQFLPPFLKIKMDETAEKAIAPIIKRNCGQCVLEFDEASKDGFTSYDPFPSCLSFPKVPYYDLDIKGLQPQQQQQEQQEQQQPQQQQEEPLSVAATDDTNSQQRNLVEEIQEEASSINPVPVVVAASNQTDIIREGALLLRSVLQTLRYTMREATAEIGTVIKESDDFLFKTLSVLNVDGAVIYLDCASAAQSPDDQKVLSIPYYTYASKISRGVSRISILASGRCQKRVPVLEQYALGLREFMSNMFEEATVSLSYMDSHSGVAFAHMFLAKQFIGPPSESIVLPILANRKYKIVIKSDDLYPWMPLMVEILQSQGSGKGFEDHVHLIDSPVLELTNKVEWPSTLKKLMTVRSELLLDDNETEEQPKEIEQVQLAKVSSLCSRVRGRWGRWTQDFNYAKLAQYVSPVQGYTGMADAVFKPSEDEPFRKPTTYKWVDSFESSCPVHLMTKDSFCDLFKTLGLGRIMFVGDSLTFHWSQSFWKLLGHEDTPVSGTQVGVNEGYHWNGEIHCNDEQTISALFIRSDNLDIHTKGREGCGDHSGTCFEWATEYNDNPTPTLLLANTGSHTAFDENFRNDFNEFFIHLDELNRKDDVVFFRTSVPGHRECLFDDLEPYHNYTQYEQTLDDSYNPYEGSGLPNINAYTAFHWDHFAPYNKYVHNLLDTRAAHLEKHPGALERQITIEVLDVMPMTILRPDGHASSPDCQGCGLRKGNIGDCLHYSLPGPIDWWNHLLFTQLSDVSNTKAARQVNKT